MFHYYVSELWLNVNAFSVGFADDFNFLNEGVTYNDINNTIQATIKDAIKWFNCNKLIVNVDKTNIIVFSFSTRQGFNLMANSRGKSK